MRQLHVKNHYVPECYLKRWCNRDGKVYVYRTLVAHQNVPNWKPQSASSIAYQKHFYTRMICGSESDEVEVWLSREFESPANDALDKATSDKKLTKSDWDALIRFLAAQDVRTPARLLEYIRRHGKRTADILDEIMTELPEKLANKDFDHVKAERNPRGSEAFPLKVSTEFEKGSDYGVLTAKTYIGRSSWIYSMKYVLNNTRKHLHTHKWSIVKPAKGYTWPTSDNPVVKLNYYGSGSYDLKGGWGSEKGNIIFPIGPEHAMFVQIGDKPVPKGYRFSVDKTKEVISIICENAHRYIFSSHVDEKLPIVRPRIVDRDALKREQHEIEQWHENNVKMELEYSPGE